MKIHKSLTNSQKIKNYTIFRKEKVWKIQICHQKLPLTYLKCRKGRLTGNIAENDLKMTSRWPSRSKLTSNHQINPFIWFLDPKNPLKMVSHMGPIFWWFFSIFLYFAYFFLPLGQKCHRVQWSDNLRWFRYPITFQKNQVPKNP